ncbi:hypothetical protein [Blastopirellula marina]|uniref:hypothetical protein n=1 Tax=Blastopirellula marina TaxID=124 RepID=UPI0011B0BB56|nr:hypothetical protein [Blastopirellula marina]
MFAREALTLGYKLTAVLPFAKSEFEQDFQPEKALEEDSLQAFRSLLEKADPVFQLDGSRTNEGRAYGVAGRTVLFNSDLLIVIWDGERQNKPGGTEETLADAQQAGIPVIWIHAEAGHAWRLLDPSVAWGELKKEDEPQEGQGDFDELGTRIETVLGLPQIASGKHEAKVDSSHKHLANFYREKNPGWKLSVGWKAFRDILGDFKFPRVTFAVKP